MDIDLKLKNIIANIANKEVDIVSINDETTLTNDLEFNSLEIIELIVELESQFKIEIEDDDLEIEKLSVYKLLFEMVKGKINLNNIEKEWVYNKKNWITIIMNYDNILYS